MLTETDEQVLSEWCRLHHFPHSEKGGEKDEAKAEAYSRCSCEKKENAFSSSLCKSKD